MRTFWSGNSAFIWNIPKHISFLLGSNSLRTKKTKKNSAAIASHWIPLIPPVLKPCWPWKFQKEWFAWSWRCCDELDHGVVGRWLWWNFITCGWFQNSCIHRFFSQCSPRIKHEDVLLKSAQIAWLWNEVMNYRIYKHIRHTVGRNPVPFRAYKM